VFRTFGVVATPTNVRERRHSSGRHARLPLFLDWFKKAGQDRTVPTPDHSQLLRDAGLRVTRPRLAVLTAVA
jgi:hypothetical protein